MLTKSDLVDAVLARADEVFGATEKQDLTDLFVEIILREIIAKTDSPRTAEEISRVLGDGEA